MQNIPAYRKSGWGLKLLLILIIAAIAVYFLAKYGIIQLPFKLPF